MAKDAMAGTVSGSTILKKICPCPAPSTRAASMTSPGISRMKLCSRKIASGSAKIECAIHTWVNEPAPRKPSNNVSPPTSSPREKSESSGTRVIWIGTICRANTPTNSQSLPLKSIHANA
jgi:hypothetical protein